MMVEELTYDDNLYEEWVASRRAAEPSHDLTDQVMAALKDQAEERLERERFLRLADRMNESRPARLAACLAALMVGSLPFLFVAYVAQSRLF